MATIHLPPDFKEFLKLLNLYQIDYLLIGGYAVGYHGYPRATADLDIWISTDPINTERIVNCLKEFGFDLPELSPQIFQEADRVVRMGVPPIRIEILTTISGVEFQVCYKDRLKIDFDGVHVNMIDLANLKINKKASGRFKDLNDLENLP